jgi:pyruvate/2-oxoacid:ferredoxin oxidoreductase beta subunit/Pyruvate/2-oxoacid:ferredoxin oxidoreductase gamma subunit
MSEFLTTPDFPYCKGCGHHHVARYTVEALEALGLSPLDVVLVTDIGCHGIVDRVFTTHTVHGLHGRSVALAAGITMNLPPDKRVIVYIGDGGATIGLQHLLEAARLNVDVTVVLHNNLLYGMTGGQPSGLTPCDFRTPITPEGNPHPNHDLPKLVIDSGAAYASRIIGMGNFTDALREAMEVEGFSLIEVMELCTSYAIKFKPDFRLREVAKQFGYQPGVWKGEARPVFRLGQSQESPSLLDMDPVPVRFTSSLEKPESVVMGGSAGEGVQRACELFAQAGMACGLHATKKGSYPVTVGVGFSTAEVILSPDPIAYHGISQPDAVIITTFEGLNHNLSRIQAMDAGALWIDAGLEIPQTGADVVVRDFSGRAGPRNAALYALLAFVQETGAIPAEALVEAVRQSSIGGRIPADLLEEFASA